MQLPLRFWENFSYNSYLKRITLIALIFGILVLAFTIRLQGRERIPEGQFTSNDAYLYYWPAQTISEHGHLPPKDEYRWAPNGRDNGQLLSLYAYVLAYTHKVVKMFFYDVSLYQVSLSGMLCILFGTDISDSHCGMRSFTADEITPRQLPYSQEASPNDTSSLLHNESIYQATLVSNPTAHVYAPLHIDTPNDAHIPHHTPPQNVSVEYAMEHKAVHTQDIQ